MRGEGGGGGEGGKKREINDKGAISIRREWYGLGRARGLLLYHLHVGRRLQVEGVCMLANRKVMVFSHRDEERLDR